MFSNKVYDVLKFLAQYVLPALASLYYGLSAIWGLPYSEQVVGTILAVDAFLGALLGISLIQYNKKQSDKYVQAQMPEIMEQTASSKSVFAMKSTTYDIFYWIVQVVLPALGTLYFALSSIWSLPYSEEIVGTITLIDTFLGIFLGISTSQYNKLNSGVSPT
jgi:hypothetical protein